MIKNIFFIMTGLFLLVFCVTGFNVYSASNYGGRNMSVKLTSPAFKEGGMIPIRYTCDDANVSPQLMWDGASQGTKSFAIIVDDPDAPMGTWVHWVVYNIPHNVVELQENVPPEKTLPDGTLQGTNDFRRIGYGGPCPPGGTHRYFFKIYALDAFLKLDAGATKIELLKAMEGHIISEGKLMGKYSRNR